MRYKLFILVLILITLRVGYIVWQSPKKPIEVVTHLKPIDFNDLPGWSSAKLHQSLKAFQISCRAFLNHQPDKEVGSGYLSLKAEHWQPICRAAKEVNEQSQQDIKLFFETWFNPYHFHEDKPVEGLFTGYYMPIIEGRLKKSETFSTPIYGVPNNLITVDFKAFDLDLGHHLKIIGRIQGKRLVPYYTRSEINHGAIKDKAKVLLWIKDPVDRQFLEIEGSGVIEFPDGKRWTIGYAGENGRPYTSIASILIKMGVMTKDNASMKRIRAYFKAHPEKVQKILDQNKSFVFFNKLNREAALGSQGVALTPGYSLAVDRKWVPMGVPIWLDTTHPQVNSTTEHKPLRRLMVAQDTGGAIRGPVRGDVYWGPGKHAAHIAGHMKNPGYYWLLLPKTMNIPN